MSLVDLTRNCFQSGISPHKWLELCKLFLSQQLSSRLQVNVEVDLSNSVLILFRSYPGDLELRDYLKHAIEARSLSLATFVATLLQAARSSELHTPATLNILCRIALDEHYSSGLSSMGSVISYNETPVTILGIVQDAFALLRTAHSLPLSHFHHLTASTSELVVLLLSCVSDVSQISPAQAMVHVADANDLLQNFRLTPDLRHVLETFVLSLSLLIGDDAKAAREAQIMHTIQLSLGKGNTLGPNSDTDIVTFSLIFNHLVSYRGHNFGSGDSRCAVSLFVATFRWAAWTPVVFYTQMLLSAFTCLSQSASNAFIWKSFVVGRLPQLLVQFESAVNADGVNHTDWRLALQQALQMNCKRVELIAQCDQAIAQVSQVQRHSTMQDGQISQSFLRDFLHSMIGMGLVTSTFAITIDPFINSGDSSRLQAEAQDCGIELETYLETKFTSEAGVEDLSFWINRAAHDATSHGAFSTVILRRFSSLSATFDVDSLSHLCKVLYLYEVALDIIALYSKVSDLLVRALSFLDQYDCETVGDPQTAVSHLGHVVLFVQYVTMRFHIEADSYPLGNGILSVAYLKNTDVIYPVESIGEDAGAFASWYKALFDSSSEGIEDSILRATKPKTLLKISATILLHAIKAHLLQKIDRDTLNNGVSYFMGPLLNWTLAGIIKVLIRETLQKGSIQTRTEIIQTFLLSPTCPPPVLMLCGPHIFRLLRCKRGKPPAPIPGLDIVSIWQAMERSFGIEEQSLERHLLSTRVARDYEIRQTIQTTLASARTGKSLSLDVERCIRITPPCDFLQLLWSELVDCASVGEMEISKRLATFVLTIPRSSGDTPPLLPIFLHLTIPSLIFAIDHEQPPERTVKVELLVNILSSSLTAALHLELAIHAVTGEHRYVLGQPCSGMARKLAADLRTRRDITSRAILERLASSQTFTTNFPVFMGELG